MGFAGADLTALQNERCAGADIYAAATLAGGIYAVSDRAGLCPILILPAVFDGQCDPRIGAEPDDPEPAAGSRLQIMAVQIQRKRALDLQRASKGNVSRQLNFRNACVRSRGSQLGVGTDLRDARGGGCDAQGQRRAKDHQQVKQAFFHLSSSLLVCVFPVPREKARAKEPCMGISSPCKGVPPCAAIGLAPSRGSPFAPRPARCPSCGLVCIWIIVSYSPQKSNRFVHRSPVRKSGYRRHCHSEEIFSAAPTAVLTLSV